MIKDRHYNPNHVQRVDNKVQSQTFKGPPNLNPKLRKTIAIISIRKYLYLKILLLFRKINNIIIHKMQIQSQIITIKKLSTNKYQTRIQLSNRSAMITKINMIK